MANQKPQRQKECFLEMTENLGWLVSEEMVEVSLEGNLDQTELGFIIEVLYSLQF